jgi:tetratricopeptide (TPR) repeat protein
MHSADELVAGMGHDDWLVRCEVIDRLLARAPEDERTVPVLLEHLRRDESSEVRGAIASALWWLAPSPRGGQLHRQHDMIVETLIASERDLDSDVRWHVQDSLYEFGLRPPPGDSTPEIRAGDDRDYGTPADIAFRWGVHRAALGDLKAALADFDEAIRLNPEQAVYVAGRALARDRLEDRSGAIADLSEAIRLQPLDASLLERRGDLRERDGDLEGAIADFGEAIRLDPEFGDAFVGRACVLWELGDLEGAITDFGEAIRLNPEDLQLLGFRADVRLLTGDAAGALADHDDAVRFNPADVRVYRARATTRDVVGDLDGAISDCEKALRLAPGDAGLERRLKTLRRRHRHPLKRLRGVRQRRRAGHNYLLLATECQTSLESIDQRHLRDGYVPVEVLRQWCAETAPVYQRVAEELRRLTWPPDAHVEADTLAKAASGRAAVYDAAARATADSEALGLLHADVDSERTLSNAVHALRLALAIPLKVD